MVIKSAEVQQRLTPSQVEALVKEGKASCSSFGFSDDPRYIVQIQVSDSIKPAVYVHQVWWQVDNYKLVNPAAFDPSLRADMSRVA